MMMKDQLFNTYVTLKFNSIENLTVPFHIWDEKISTFYFSKTKVILQC